jgi:hypothetical protein
MANYKAQATAQYLAQDLQNRTGLTCTVDLSGADPIVNIGNPTAGNRGAKVKVLDQRNGYAAPYVGATGAGFTDIIGNAQPVYTGSIFQIAVERAGAAGTYPISTSLTPTQLLNVIGDLTRRGGRVELWGAANGNDPAWTALEGAFEPNLNWSISGRV